MFGIKRRRDARVLESIRDGHLTTFSLHLATGLSLGAVYAATDRLIARGLITRWPGAPKVERGGRRAWIYIPKRNEDAL